MCLTYCRHHAIVCYMLCVFCGHRIPETSLHDVFHATVISKLTHCASSWSGACSAADRAKLESFISRCKRLGYCSHNQTSYSQLISDADDSFFKRITPMMDTCYNHSYLTVLPSHTASVKEHTTSYLSPKLHISTTMTF